MSKSINIARFTLAFIIIAGGFSFIVGSMMGGGSSRVYDSVKGVNNDPRSILVEAVLLQVGSDSSMTYELPEAGVRLTDGAFEELVSEAMSVGMDSGVRVRTPAMLVQHGESGSITLKIGERYFEMDVTPRVIDLKHGSVMRVAMEINSMDTDSSAAKRELAFATAYTAAPGGVTVLDLAGFGEPGTRAVLGLRTTLSDPTPVANN